jgi:molybdopterin molybdotransferase/putative molybdopterin biosynthesis protein
MASQGDSLRRAREARGLTQLDLARRAGISRQALGAIEAGTYQPGVTVALALARELGDTVEGLFDAESSKESRRIRVSWTGHERLSTGPSRSIALARIGGKVVAVEQPGVRLTLSPTGGMLEGGRRREAEVDTFRTPEEIDSTLLIAGCDPSVAMLSDWLARSHSPVSAAALPCSSSTAIRALLDGRAHAAGVHLRDPASGEYNMAYVRRALGRRRSIVINFARWELGLATDPANRHGIREFADLARKGLRIINRERGSGARLALDEGLREVGLKAGELAGYENELGGHLEVAEAIAAGRADVAVTIRVAANAYGLGFVPLREERYDVVVLERDFDSKPVKAMLDALSSNRFAREVNRFCAYATDQMGRTFARIA